MHAFAALTALVLALLAFTGCERTPTPAAGSGSGALSAPTPAPPPAGGNPAEAWLNNGRPQGGLPRLKLYLGAQELNAELALSTEAIQKGMMWRTNVPDTDGMLFVFGRAHQTGFWMKNVPIDIDVAYLDPEGAILEIHRLERQNTNPVVAKTANVQYALETAVGWFERKGVGVKAVVRTERGSLPETFFGGRTGR